MVIIEVALMPEDFIPPSDSKLLSATAGEAHYYPASRLELKTSWSRWWLVLPGLLILIISGCAGLYATKTSYMKVALAGLPATRHPSSRTLEKELTSKVSGYQVKLQRDGAPGKSYSLQDMGLRIDVPASVRSAVERPQAVSFFHRMKFWQTDRVPLVVTADETNFTAFVNGKATEVTTPAQNANLVLDKGVVAIIPAVAGQSFAVPDAKNTLLQGVAHFQSTIFRMEKHELKPAIADSDLASAKQKVNAALSQDVTLTIASKKIKATASDIGNWLELTPVESDKTIDVTVNSGKVLEYLNALTKPYITPQRAEVVSINTDGNPRVLIPGQNGADISKKETVAANIAKKVLAGNGATIDLPVTYAPFKSITAQAYDKWLAVDVTNKRMYAYQKTELVNTLLVSAGAPATPTVLGQYAIYAKFAKQDMRGNNADGSRYSQPNVQWVNYFYKDYAVHGNYWRPTSYFGNINSSHGCVGVINNDAEWVYNWAPIGTPVIVYD